MDSDKILLVKKRHLLLMQVLCWAVPGIKIIHTGLQSMNAVRAVHPDRCWWLWLIDFGVIILFVLMFRNFVKRYINRILDFPDPKKSIFAFFDLRGYLTIFFMIALGISLKHIPAIPTEFFAAFYPGLGTALTLSGLKFLKAWRKESRIV